jgi:ATP-dependent Clp protease ATP-binding subunit ClpA
MLTWKCRLVEDAASVAAAAKWLKKDRKHLDCTVEHWSLRLLQETDLVKACLMAQGEYQRLRMELASRMPSKVQTDDLVAAISKAAAEEVATASSLVQFRAQLQQEWEQQVRLKGQSVFTASKQWFEPFL